MVYTIKISNEITNRFDLLECPTREIRAQVLGQYINSLTKSPNVISCNDVKGTWYVTHKNGKRVILECNERPQ